ncbi:MAG: hypothetical protein GF331_07405 [Chitinivibrionales bacterium]|nr:hypothetical protein [Chitinivibrionales bacterium]
MQKMLNTRILRPGLVAALMLSGQDCHHARQEHMIEISVRNEESHSIDNRLFGQFLERPSWGETGPESAVDSAGRLPPDIREMLSDMYIPIVRFPGGTDIDYIDWTDMISGAPGRGPDRPVTVGHKGDTVSNRLGFDEYCALSEDMGWESIIVVNFLDGLGGRKPLADAARHAAGLVAYLNAPVGARLPPGMPDWPGVRARNGRTEPYNIRIFQIGNEWGMPNYHKLALQGAPDPNKVADWYRECIVAYTDAMRAVDPTIEIIVDYLMQKETHKDVFADTELTRHFDYVSRHAYQPGPIRDVTAEGRNVPYDSISPSAWLLALSSMPGHFDSAGNTLAFGEEIVELRALGVPIAVTEWNWNPWSFTVPQDVLQFPRQHGTALGVAGFIHGLMRQGDIIHLATQSMLIGHRWDISAIRYDPDGTHPTYRNAQGTVTEFYGKHHGGALLEADVRGVQKAPQPYAMGWAKPVDRVALQDILVTRDRTCVYVHCVNKALRDTIGVEIDVRELGITDGTAIHRTLEGNSTEEFAKTYRWLNESAQDVDVRNDAVSVLLPPKSISVVRISGKSD